ncbi:hypothetical protein ACOMHN_044252 [Nucella lapillus]
MLHKRLVRVCVLQAVLWSVRSSPTQAPSLSHSDEQTVAASFDPKSRSSLVLLQLLFRHGDRSAINLFPWDQHHSAWPQGPGQLTKVGMEQTYKYGGELRKMYASFLPTSYDRFAVAVQSTDYDRTLMTAQCLLVGLFPANSSQWSLSPWQPIPIHTSGALFGHAPCPMIEVLNKQKDYAEKSENLKLKYKPLVDDLSSGTNTSVNISVAFHIADTMFCEAEHNMSRPVWMTEAMFEGLMNLTDSNYQLQYTAPGVPRLTGGPLLAEMTSNMERRAHNSSKEKLFLFSGHDSTVSALGQAMGTFNEVKPPYLTTIIVELHQQGPAFFVKTLFHNHTDNSPYVTAIEGMILWYGVYMYFIVTYLTTIIVELHQQGPAFFVKTLFHNHTDNSPYVTAIEGMILWYGVYMYFIVTYLTTIIVELHQQGPAFFVKTLFHNHTDNSPYVTAIEGMILWYGVYMYFIVTYLTTIIVELHQQGPAFFVKTLFHNHTDNSPYVTAIEGMILWYGVYMYFIVTYLTTIIVELHQQGPAFFVKTLFHNHTDNSPYVTAIEGMILWYGVYFIVTYLTTIIVELHQQGPTFFVKTLFHNHTDNSPYVTAIEGMIWYGVYFIVTYLTTIIVELHQQGPAFFVKTLFHNHTDNSPYVTAIEGMILWYGVYMYFIVTYLTTIIVELHQQGPAFFVKTLFYNHTDNSPYVTAIEGMILWYGVYFIVTYLTTIIVELHQQGPAFFVKTLFHNHTDNSPYVTAIEGMIWYGVYFIVTYLTTIIVELHQQGPTFFVKTLFHNHTDNSPYVTAIEGMIWYGVYFIVTYLTTIIVELHQQGPTFFVKTLFHNHTDNSPYVTAIEGCAQMCPLSEFRRLLTDRMLPVAGREEACALTVSTASQFWRDNGASVLLGVVMVMVVTVTVLAYKLRKGRVPQRERNHVRYHKLLQHGAHNDDDGHADS